MNAFHQRWFPSGFAVVSGAGEIWLWRVGQPPERLLEWGHEPVPIDDLRFIFHDGDARRGTYIYDFTKPATERVARIVGVGELVELAGGAGKCAGVDPGVGIRWFERNEQGEWKETGLTRGAGQPFIAADGSTVWRNDDAHQQPSCGFGVQAWHDGRATTVTGAGETHVYPNEHRPRIFRTPFGAGLVTMAGNPSTKLRIRPKWNVNEGYERTPGNDNNDRADAIFQARIASAQVVYQSTGGTGFLWTQPFDEKPRPFVDAPKPPEQPKPEPKPEPVPVSTVNHEAIVRRVADAHPHLIQANTFDSCGEFVQRVLAVLNAEDGANEWGHVGKTGGEAGFVPKGSTQRVSHDCVFSRRLNQQYKITGYSAANSHPDPNEVRPGPAIPMWAYIDPKFYRSSNPWVAAIPVSGEEPKPQTPPAQTPPETPAPNVPSDVERELLRRLEAIESLLRGPFVITVKSEHGYLSIQGDGRIEWNRQDVGSWEILRVERK